MSRRTLLRMPDGIGSSIGGDFPSESPFSPLALALDRRIAAGRSRLIAFTAAATGEGVSTAIWHTAVELGSIYARSVTIIELDAEPGSLSRKKGLSGGSSLSGLIGGTPSAAHVGQRVAKNVLLVPGRVDHLPRLTQPTLRATLDAAAAGNDIVLLDLPPVLRSGDALLAAGAAGAAIIVVGANASPVQAVQRTSRELSLAGAEVLGTVLNRVPKLLPNWLYRFLG